MLIVIGDETNKSCDIILPVFNAAPAHPDKTALELLYTPAQRSLLPSLDILFQNDSLYAEG